MKYTTSAIALTSLLALFQVSLADSESFGIVSIRSGSPVQYLSVYPSNGVLVVASSSGNDISAVVTDLGYLKFSDGSYAGLSSSGEYIAVTDVSKATSGWSISDSSLELNGNTPFVAVSSGSSYDLYNTGSSDTDYGIALLPFTSAGSSAADFTPSSSGSSSSSSSSSSSASASTTSASSVAVVSQITDGQIQATTTTLAPSSVSSVAVVSQITDGQIQATTATSAFASSSVSSVAVVSQITDGQIQATTATSASASSSVSSVSSVAVVSQITDGQIQATQSGNGATQLGGSLGLMAVAAAFLL